MKIAATFSTETFTQEFKHCPLCVDMLEVFVTNTLNVCNTTYKEEEFFIFDNLKRLFQELDSCGKCEFRLHSDNFFLDITLELL